LSENVKEMVKRTHEQLTPVNVGFYRGYDLRLVGRACNQSRGNILPSARIIRAAKQPEELKKAAF
jgi:hypothetical protein